MRMLNTSNGDVDVALPLEKMSADAHAEGLGSL